MSPMQQLSQSHITILIDLFRTSKGEIETFHPVPPETVPELEELLFQRLVILAVNDESEQETEAWFAALTTAGCDVALALTEKHTKKLPLTFNTLQPEQAACFDHLQDLPPDDVAAFLSQLLTLHDALKQGGIDDLLRMYPDLNVTYREMVRSAVESQLMTHEQQRIEQLIDEIGDLKTLMAKQTEQPSIVFPAKEAEHAPSLIPTSLRPVQAIPQYPLAQPRQLDAPEFDVPDHEDEEDDDLFVVQEDAEAGHRAGENFLQALQKLQG